MKCFFFFFSGNPVSSALSLSFNQEYPGSTKKFWLNFDIFSTNLFKMKNLTSCYPTHLHNGTSRSFFSLKSFSTSCLSLYIFKCQSCFSDGPRRRRPVSKRPHLFLTSESSFQEPHMSVSKIGKPPKSFEL